MRKPEPERCPPESTLISLNPPSLPFCRAPLPTPRPPYHPTQEVVPLNASNVVLGSSADAADEWEGAVLSTINGDTITPVGPLLDDMDDVAGGQCRYYLEGSEAAG